MCSTAGTVPTGYEKTDQRIRTAKPFSTSSGEPGGAYNQVAAQPLPSNPP